MSHINQPHKIALSLERRNMSISDKEMLGILLEEVYNLGLLGRIFQRKRYLALKNNIKKIRDKIQNKIIWEGRN
jgi:hypothetical protein